MQRTAYIPVITPFDSFEKALQEDVLILRATPPDTPFVKVKITVTSRQDKYSHEREKLKAPARSRRTGT